MAGLDRHNTMPKLLRQNAANYGRRVALREKDLGIWQRISWQDYLAHVRNFALGLKELGLEDAEDKVSILADNCPEWLYADLAAQSCRAYAVGIYPTNVAEQVRFLLDNSLTGFVVCGDQEQTDKVLEIRDQLPRLKKIIVIDMKGLRKYKDPMVMSFEEVESLGQARHDREPDYFDRLVEATEPDDVAIMVYTSGTTGVPKGAMITHRNMLAMISGLASFLPFSDRDTFVSALPLCHVAERSFSMIFPMYAGCTVNFAESVATLQEDMQELSPTAFLSVPRIWEKMHTRIQIRIKDAIWIKRHVLPGPDAGGLSGGRPEAERTPRARDVAAAEPDGLLSTVPSSEKQAGAAQRPHFRQRRRPPVP